MWKISKILLSLVLTLSLLHLFDLGRANAEGTTKHDEIVAELNLGNKELKEWSDSEIKQYIQPPSPLSADKRAKVLLIQQPPTGIYLTKFHFI